VLMRTICSKRSPAIGDELLQIEHGGHATKSSRP
jgi:hypothetical protein